MASQLPECAIPCFIAAIGNSTCGALDTACQCSTPQISQQAGSCILASCPVREALSAANITSIQCGHTPAKDNSFFAPVVTFAVLAGISVTLRPVARLITKNRFWWDDLFNLVAAAICFVVFGITKHAINLGLGTEMWAVPPDNIPVILAFSFMFMLLYGLCRFFTRLSIIMFYFRVFGLTDARPYLIGIFVFNILFVIVFIFVMCFQCTPLSHFWLRWDGIHPGYCINANTYTLALGVIEAAEDLVLIALPFPFLQTLKLTWAKRFSVSFMFAIGLLTFIITVVRIPTIVKFTLAADVTLSGVPIALWSNLELQIGLICACLPALYPMMRQAGSRLMTLTSSLRGGLSTSGRSWGTRVVKSASSPRHREGQFGVGNTRNTNGTGPDLTADGACRNCGHKPEPSPNTNSPKNKLGGSFRAWGINTISDITVTTKTSNATLSSRGREEEVAPVEVTESLGNDMLGRYYSSFPENDV
ncbi:hypothetical protein V8F06_013450 [Rhypophila decipiens]